MSAHSVVFTILFVGVVLSDGTDSKLFLDAELSVVTVGCRRLDRDAVDNPGGTLNVLFVGICNEGFDVLVYTHYIEYHFL